MTDSSGSTSGPSGVQAVAQSESKSIPSLPALHAPSILEDHANWIDLYRQIAASTSGQYFLTIEQKRYKYTNLIMTRGFVTIGAYDPATTPKPPITQVLFELDVQHDPEDFWHTWISHPNGTEYLLVRGVKLGAVLVSVPGQEVIQITTPYEWRSAVVSPDGKSLAVACHEDSSMPVRVFDFSSPTVLPYYEYQIERLPPLEGIKPYEMTVKWSARDPCELECSAPVHRKDKLSFGHDYYYEEFPLGFRRHFSPGEDRVDRGGNTNRAERSHSRSDRSHSERPHSERSHSGRPHSAHPHSSNTHSSRPHSRPHGSSHPPSRPQPSRR